MKRVITALFIMTGMCCNAASAHDAIELPTDQHVEIVQKVEAYLNRIKTFRADFIQVGRSGDIVLGKLLLKRPSKLKMDYTNPSRLVILVKGDRVISYDRELKEKTETSVYALPISFLVDKKINLHKNVRVMYAREEKQDILIKFCKNDDDEGAVLLRFSKEPFELCEWSVFASKEQEDYSKAITVRLSNIQNGAEISDGEFEKYSSNT